MNFTYQNNCYECSTNASYFYSYPDTLLMPPDGTVLKIISWQESYPPVPLEIEEFKGDTSKYTIVPCNRVYK